MTPEQRERKRLYAIEWRKKNPDKQKKCNRETRKRAVAKRREWYRTLKSNLSCECCGESHPACLDFHHRDPSKKFLEVSVMVRDKYPIYRIQEEVDKCSVLCKNCHAKQHWREAMSIRPQDMKHVSKPWGHELWICNSELYCGKILFIKKGCFCSFHWHERKDEVLYVQTGELWFTWQQGVEPAKTELLPAGHAFHVTPGVRHQMEAIEDTTILEFSTQHFDEDSFRVTQECVRIKEKI